MSRSNPPVALPNPSTRWFKFNGSTGKVTYFDTVSKTTINVDEPFKVIVLEVLAMARGYDEDAQTDMFSNEVRNIATEELTVKRRKGEKVAKGIWKDIRDACLAVGAEFHSSIYLAYKDGETLKIGNLRLKGSPVSAWMAFEKKNRAQIYEQAVEFVGTEEFSKGQIKWKTPKFRLVPLSPETQEAAKALDVTLQAYLRSVAVSTSRPVDDTPHVSDEDVASQPSLPDLPPPVDDTLEIFDDDIPF